MGNEQLPSRERGGEHQRTPAEQKELEKDLHEKLKNEAEKAGESREKIADLVEKVDAEAAPAEKAKNQNSKSQRSAPDEDALQPGQMNRSFKTTMDRVRRHENPAERAFSKVIHNKAVEKVSDVAGATVARPSGIAGGAILAFLGLSIAYAVARYAGFTLSGSETLFLLAGGFILGLLIEWFYRSIRTILATRK